MNNSANAKRAKHPYLHDDFWLTNLEYFCSHYPSASKRYINNAIAEQKERERKSKDHLTTTRFNN